MNGRHICLCGHDGPSQHARDGACFVCGCAMFDQIVPHIYRSEFPVWPINCGACGQPFNDGEEYRSLWVDLDCAELVCVRCAEASFPY